MTWKIKGGTLQVEDWYYHLWHLTDHIEYANDCKVCRWYYKLNPNTIKEMTIHDNDPTSTAS